MDPGGTSGKRAGSTHGVGEVSSNQAYRISILEDVAPVRRSRLLVPSVNEGHPIKDTGIQFEKPQAPISVSGVSGVSGVVDDAGDSDQLRDTACNRPLGPGFDTLAHTGSHLSSTSDTDRPESLPDGFESDSLFPLGQVIRSVMINAAGQHDLQFLPVSELDTIVAIPHISEELRRSGVSTNVNLIAHQVYDPVGTTSEPTTRRKIFGILCLMENAAAIIEFINEKVYDVDLPFEFDHQGVHRRSNSTIELFTKWKDHEKDTFKTYQGQFLAPYFKLGQNPAASFGKYTLHHCMVLPFVENEAEDSAEGYHMIGGTSDVRKVKIHTAHYDHAESPIPSEKAYFAVKEIRKSGAAERPPNRETDAYRRLNPIRHPHIVRLLGTYLHKGKLHLIFPWADGNLHQFWKKHYPRKEDLHRGHPLAKWLIEQFLGLSTAIVRIHDLASSSLSTQDQAQNHGRHGDFKPENVLWFKNSSGSGSIGSLGTLMVSDLGSTEFHGTHSQDVHASKVSGYTETYKAPEFDKMREVSPKADIWSFACVLLEFLVWYTHGLSGIVAFIKARKNDSNLYIPGDHFFNYNKTDNTVALKVSVTQEFTKLREASNSDFILDLLDFIESRMLLARPDDRATCKEIAEKFSTMRERCGKDAKYCTEKTQKDIARTTTDRSDNVAVPLSREQQYEYEKNTRDPNLRMPPLSIAPSLVETARDDSRSRTSRGSTDNASNLRIPASRKTDKDTSAEDLQTQRVKDPGHASMPEQEAQYMSRRKRLWSFLKAATSCFRPKDDT